MTRPSCAWLLIAAVAVTGCPDDAPKAEPVSSAAPDDKLRSAKPKAYAKTQPQALGTVPEGVGIAVGETAPDFELAAHAAGKTSLDDLLKRGEALLVFYRGGW